MPVSHGRCVVCRGALFRISRSQVIAPLWCFDPNSGLYLHRWVERLQDGRIASDADPYKVAAATVKTTKEALA